MKDGNLSGWKVAAIPISFWVIIGSVIYFWNARHEKNVAEQIRNAKPVVVKNITRVLMHEPWSYTFLVRNQNNRIGQLLVRWSGSVEIFDDLPAGESVRVEIMCGGVDRPMSCRQLPQVFSEWRIERPSKLVIHLHSVSQIDGGGWNHGKFGSGTTMVVE